MTIEIPPLRERKEDLPMLIDFFVEKSQMELKKRITTIDEGLMKVLKAYNYPGNIRELKNIIERLIVMAEGDTLTLEDAEKYNIFSNREGLEDCSKRSLKEVRSAAEKKHIADVLNEKGHNMELAAEILEISSRQLYNKTKEYGIKIK